MITAVETTIAALVYIVQVVPIGTNISLVRILWVMVNGSFVSSRGAIHPALSSNGFSDEEVRRSWAALRYGSWSIAELLSSWQLYVRATNEWQERKHARYRVKSIDITGFWRPHLPGQVNQHYSSLAQRALPAVIFGVMVISGEIQGKRVPLLEEIVRCAVGTSETEFRRQLLQNAASASRPDEIAVMDAGFSLSEVHEAQLQQFVVRMARNCTARKNVLPPYKGRGRYPEYGVMVRPLARTRCDSQIAATPAECSGEFVHQGRTIRYEAWHNLVTTDTKVSCDNPTVSIVVFYDPHYSKPMVLATDMALKPETLYQVYRDRWSVEHPPLAAKQMLGLHRQFVFADDTCFRLPELALLAGNVLTHCAAILPPVPTGFWDRTPQATPGRLRRLLSHAIFPNLLEFDPQLRKKNSVSDHLPKGSDAHRRHTAHP